MIKRKFFVLLSLFICLLLSGCIIWKDENKNIYEYYTNMKYDSKSSYGKRCAYYNGRIYFFSNKDKVNGIYSMKENGEDLKFEGIETKGIRKLQIKDEQIYYISYNGEEKVDKKVYQKYSLRCKERDHIKKILPGRQLSIDTEEQERVENNMFDFYCDNNAIYIQTHMGRAPEGTLMISSFILQNNDKVEFDKYECLSENTESAEEDDEYCLALYNGIIYSMRYPPYFESPGSDFISVDTDVYPFDKKQNHLIINYSPWLKNNDMENILQTNYKGYWLFTNQNKIKRVKENTNKMETVVELKGIKDIVFFLNLGKQAYIVAEKEDEADRCFVMDMDTYKVQEMFECVRDEYILAIDEGKLVTLKDSKICIRSIKAGSVSDSMKEIKFNERVNIRDYKFEVAANWMFVYHYNSERLYDLSYRVNMDTGEVK